MSWMRYGEDEDDETEQKKIKKTVGSCECCGNYVYDEENEYYVCEVDLD
mgnify:CR=1 FL=1